MELGSTIILLYISGAAGLGLVALIYTVRTKSQAKASRERLRRIRRTLEGAR
jgi:hypothetical protein